jgi:uncharacterized protein (TIGR02246 family)
MQRTTRIMIAVGVSVALVTGAGMSAAAVTPPPSALATIPAIAEPISPPPMTPPTPPSLPPSTTLPPTPSVTPTTPPVPCSQGNSAQQLPTEAEIRELFTKWNEALLTEDANKVADLYAADAVLQPTRSSEIRTTRARIVDYFKNHFLPLKPQARVTQRTIKILGLNSAADYGLYEFTVTRNGRLEKIKARYTFVYERCGVTWRIINHHSSAVPADE